MTEFPSVDALMAGGLADWLRSQQLVREEAKAVSRRRLMIGWGAGAAVAVILAVIALHVGSVVPLLVAFVPLLIVGVLGVLWASRARQPVIDSIKTQMNTAIARALGLRFSVAGHTGPEFDRAEAYGLLPSHDRCTVEDFWYGQTPAGGFTLYESELEERRKSGKNHRWVTVFHGAIITIGFARPFHGTTVVERDNQRMKFFGLRQSIEVDDRKLERVRMVDPRFEGTFEIWSTDPVEARYLVHPAYVERLIEVEQRFQGMQIRALFDGGSLTIVIETEKLFESGSLDAGRDRELMGATIGQFAALFGLATHLNEMPRS